MVIGDGVGMLLYIPPSHCRHQALRHHVSSRSISSSTTSPCCIVRHETLFFRCAVVQYPSLAPCYVIAPCSIIPHQTCCAINRNTVFFHRTTSLHYVDTSIISAMLRRASSRKIPSSVMTLCSVMQCHAIFSHSSRRHVSACIIKQLVSSLVMLIAVS